jgi:hypothetical protein
VSISENSFNFIFQMPAMNKAAIVIAALITSSSAYAQERNIIASPACDNVHIENRMRHGTKYALMQKSDNVWPYKRDLINLSNRSVAPYPKQKYIKKTPLKSYMRKDFK